VSERLSLSRGHLLALAWIGSFTLAPMLLGWTFTSLIDCGGGSACYVGETDWHDSGHLFPAISAFFTTPVGLVVLMAWIVSLVLQALNRPVAIGQAVRFPYRIYLVALLLLTLPFILASFALWLGYGVRLIDPNAASAFGLWATDISIYALVGMVIWMPVYAIHVFVASYRTAERRRAS